MHLRQYKQLNNYLNYYCKDKYFKEIYVNLKNP